MPEDASTQLTKPLSDDLVDLYDNAVSLVRTYGADYTIDALIALLAKAAEMETDHAEGDQEVQRSLMVVLVSLVCEQKRCQYLLRKFDRIREAHSKHIDAHGRTSGECNECGLSWPCPTYTWVSTNKDPVMDTWAPSDYRY